MEINGIYTRTAISQNEVDEHQQLVHPFTFFIFQSCQAPFYVDLIYYAMVTIERLPFVRYNFNFFGLNQLTSKYLFPRLLKHALSQFNGISSILTSIQTSSLLGHVARISVREPFTAVQVTQMYCEFQLLFSANQNSQSFLNWSRCNWENVDTVLDLVETTQGTVVNEVFLLQHHSMMPRNFNPFEHKITQLFLFSVPGVMNISCLPLIRFFQGPRIPCLLINVI